MSFDFSEETYQEPVEKQWMNTSGYITGKITRCEHNTSYNSIGIDIESDEQKCQFLSLYMDNKDGTKAQGYYQFMSLCKLLGINKPKKDEVSDRFEEIEGKPITLGIKFVFNAGDQYPKKYVQSIHSATSGLTYGEAIEKKPADTIKRELKDQYKGIPNNGGSGGDVGEMPAGLEPEEQETLPF